MPLKHKISATRIQHVHLLATRRHGSSGEGTGPAPECLTEGSGSREKLMALQGGSVLSARLDEARRGMEAESAVNHVNKEKKTLGSLMLVEV